MCMQIPNNFHLSPRTLPFDGAAHHTQFRQDLLNEANGHPTLAVPVVGENLGNFEL
jgi:hypothetical protein